METLKIIKVAHEKANRIILSCETSDQMISLASKDSTQLSYLRQVEESVESTLILKRKSLRSI